MWATAVKIMSYRRSVAGPYKRSSSTLRSGRKLSRYAKSLLNRSASSRVDTGLLGLSAFQSAANFPLLAKEVAKRCEQLREEIFIETDPLLALLLLDQISNEVCSVIDVSEFCRIAHDSAEYREKAEEAFLTLSMFIHSLNTDESLYSKLQHIVDTDTIFSTLPREHQLFAKDLKAEFESGGIHLRGDARDTAMSLQGDVVAAETKFLQDTSKDGDNSHFMIGPFLSEQDFQRFKSWIGQYVEQPKNLPQAYILCSSNKRIAGTILKSLDEDKLRGIVWRAMLHEPKNNIENLGNMVKNRQALAKSLGYESFAHKYLANKVIKTPKEVQEFLSKVAVTVKPKAQKQFEILRNLKYKLLVPKNSNIRLENIQLQPWDIGYLQGIAESTEQNGSGSGKNTVNAINLVSEYFPINSCIDGLIGITESLFGVKVHISDLLKTETWLEDESLSISETDFSLFKNSAKNSLKFGYFSGAIKCDFNDDNGARLGTVFLDLFHR